MKQELIDTKVPTTGHARAAECLERPGKGTRPVFTPWPELVELREKLGLKAKQERQFRFYSLHGHVCRFDTLTVAWRIVRDNDGACGVDGVTIAQIDSSPESVTRFLEGLRDDLASGAYRAQPVRRVYVEKPNGKLRPLGIPTVRDRVAQCAVKLIMEPILEADFEDCSYGFRPGRGAHDALQAVKDSLNAGRAAVYDADLASYFDTIDHAKLRAGLRQRIADGTLLRLIDQWLGALVVEIAQPEPPPGGKRNRSHRKRRQRLRSARLQRQAEKARSRGKRSRKAEKQLPRMIITRPTAGTPQGGVLSPLLANLHLHWFDRAFHGSSGPGVWANARLVRYADDFVILARYVGDRICNWVEEKIEGRLGLRINREKTRVIRHLHDDAPEGEHLDFLGYTFRYDKDLSGRPHRYLNMEPARQSCQKERDAIREMTDASQCFTPIPQLIGRVNNQTRSWAAYFKLGYPRKAFRGINRYAQERLVRHLGRRSQRAYKKPEGEEWGEHLKKLGYKPL